MRNEKALIRPFEPDDKQTLDQIRILAFQPVFRSFRALLGEEIGPIVVAAAEQEQADYFDELCNSTSSHSVFVALVDGKTVGFASASLDPDTKIGELGFAAVHPEFAGQGIGTQLCEHCLAHMTAAGMKVAAVGTAGDPSHAPARRAYQKAGFGPTIPSLWMYRTL